MYYHHQTVSAAMELSNTVEFINNTSVEGGAILLLSLSQLTLADDLQLLFDGNTGRYLKMYNSFENCINHVCFEIFKFIIKQEIETKWNT